ncbi:MAG: hypothetical protein GY744_02865 [Gammaproteobacteria bacterium]|nr:hypothetical protein [Gammaproteobacteria bacterium]
MEDNDQKILVEILQELKSQQGQEKDLWDRFSTVSVFLSTVVIAALGSYFTYSYNKQQGILEHQTQVHQTKILEMQTVEKFIPHLTSDEKTKEIALLALTTLGSSEFATKFSQLSPSTGSDAAADTIMRTAVTLEQKQIPPPLTSTANAEKEGWAYVGHYVNSKWKTRYFEIDLDAKPELLKGEVLVVREETGALNVREGMPTFTGSFKSIIGALNPGSKAKILKVEEWLSSGYMWAQIAYGT